MVDSDNICEKFKLEIRHTNVNTVKKLNMWKLAFVIAVSFTWGEIMVKN